jgi:outer membrane protein
MRIPIISATVALLAALELEAQVSPQPSAWNAMVGVAALVYPSYPGSDEYRVIPLPLGQVMYANRVYAGPSPSGFGGAVGAYAINTPRWSLGAELGLLDNRPADRADALLGMEDRDLVAMAGANLAYRTVTALGMVEAIVSGARGLNDEAGFLGTTRLSLSRQFGLLSASAGLNATFADAKQMRREFGVTEAEAIRRQAFIDGGSPVLRPDEGNPYRPDGGLRHLGASFSLAYMLSPRWSLLGFGGLDRLSDEAADSPLVRRRQLLSGGVGLGLRL